MARKVMTDYHFVTEAQFHAFCAQWFNNNYHMNRMQLFTVNNNPSDRLSPRLRVIEGTKQKAMGLIAGVSDMVFIGNGFVSFIELKLPDGTQQENQHDFQLKVLALGHVYYLIHTFEQFRDLIDQLVNI